MWRTPLKTYINNSGILTLAEFKDLPFPPKRFFMVYDVTSKRGGHAHKKCEQFIICAHGTCGVDINREDAYLLSKQDVGIYIPASTWVEYNLSKDGVLLVFASEPYDPEDYIYE